MIFNKATTGISSGQEEAHKLPGLKQIGVMTISIPSKEEKDTHLQ